MADETITAASVLATAGTTWFRRIAAVAITAGQPIAKDATGGLILADANGSTLAKIVEGIACNGGGVGQPINYVKADATFTPGFAVTEGERYFASATAGGICKAADLAAGHAVTLLFLGLANNKANLSIVAGGTVPA